MFTVLNTPPIPGRFPLRFRALSDVDASGRYFPIAGSALIHRLVLGPMYRAAK